MDHSSWQTMDSDFCYEPSTMNYELPKLRRPAGNVFLYGGYFAAVFIADGLIGLVTEHQVIIGLLLIGDGLLLVDAICTYG